MKLMDRAKESEEINAKVWRLWDQLILKRRTQVEIAKEVGITKSRVNQILKAGKKYDK